MVLPTGAARHVFEKLDLELSSLLFYRQSSQSVASKSLVFLKVSVGKDSTKFLLKEADMKDIYLEAESIGGCLINCMKESTD